MKQSVTAVRSVVFNVSFLVMTALVVTFGIPLLFLPAPRNKCVALFWARMIGILERRILGLSYVVEGRENLPDGPCILAMKHQSAWETFKLFELFGAPAIILKKELIDIPLWGRYALVMEALPIDRNNGRQAFEFMITEARARIKRGQSIVIFPQGTRVPPRDTKTSYKTGAARLYEALNVPIVPIALNSGLFWPKYTWRRRGGVVTVRIMPAIPAGLTLDQAHAQLSQTIEAQTRQIEDASGLENL